MDRVIALFRSRKFYTQGYLYKRVELDANGLPATKDNVWEEWFVQLTGSEISLWNVKEIQAASARGEQVGPQFANIVDGVVSIPVLRQIDALPTKAPKEYPYMFYLNNAGGNRIWFACAPGDASASPPESDDSIFKSWINCIRLAAWETGRLHECVGSFTR